MLTTILGVLFCIVCVLLILIILLQRGRGGGLSGAFGGAGGHTPFGAKTGDVFTWVTVGFTAVFLIMSVILNYVFVPQRYEAVSRPDLKTPPAATQPKDKTESPDKK